MKKYIILFILLFGAGIAISDIDTFEGTATDSLSEIEGSTVAAGGAICTSETDGEITTSAVITADYYLNDALRCSKVTVSNQSDITGYNLGGCDDTGPEGNNTVNLWTHDSGGDEPDSSISGTSQTFSVTTFSACDANDEHEVLLSATHNDLSSGTYWICWNEDSAGASKTAVDLSESGRTCASSDGGSNWSCYGWPTQMEILGCED
jgi:hypothetical protein